MRWLEMQAHFYLEQQCFGLPQRVRLARRFQTDQGPRPLREEVRVSVGGKQTCLLVMQVYGEPEYGIGECIVRVRGIAKDTHDKHTVYVNVGRAGNAVRRLRYDVFTITVRGYHTVHIARLRGGEHRSPCVIPPPSCTPLEPDPDCSGVHRISHHVEMRTNSSSQREIVNDVEVSKHLIHRRGAEFIVIERSKRYVQGGLVRSGGVKLFYIIVPPKYAGGSGIHVMQRIPSSGKNDVLNPYIAGLGNVLQQHVGYRVRCQRDARDLQRIVAVGSIERKPPRAIRSEGVSRWSNPIIGINGGGSTRGVILYRDVGPGHRYA